MQNDLMPNVGWKMTLGVMLTKEEYKGGHDQRLLKGRIMCHVKHLDCSFGFHTSCNFKIWS